MCNENEWEEIDYYQHSYDLKDDIARRYFSYSDQYEHKVMRRKKQEPFPVLLPGDRVSCLSSDVIVTTTYGNTIEGWCCPFKVTRRPYYSCNAIAIENIIEAERQGAVIWRKR